ncbi:MAG: hypothetical protein GY751_25505, partial [Bacteroidetes bacterium]|nr:hypothetical protein [Bacteroidota bacterium]
MPVSSALGYNKMNLEPFSDNPIIKNNWMQALKRIGKRTVIEHLLPIIEERLNHNPGVTLGSSNQFDRFFSISERIELIKDCFCDLEKYEVTLTR